MYGRQAGPSRTAAAGGGGSGDGNNGSGDDGIGLWFELCFSFGHGFGLRFIRFDSVNTGSTQSMLVNSGQQSTWSAGRNQSTPDAECHSCTLANSRS
uniref:Uncharacterized protein n=1 Tax=Helianthus annuus TaxID=4232 RepID=A0A251VIX8_HELAN